MYTYTYTHNHIYIYIYIERERDVYIHTDVSCSLLDVPCKSPQSRAPVTEPAAGI